MRLKIDDGIEAQHNPRALRVQAEFASVDQSLTPPDYSCWSLIRKWAFDQCAVG